MSSISPFTPAHGAPQTARPSEAPPPQSSAPAPTSDGVFAMRGAGGETLQVDLATMMMMIGFRRAQNLDHQITNQVADIKDRNTNIESSTAVMNALRKVRSEGADLNGMTAMAGGRERKVLELAGNLGIRLEALGRRPGEAELDAARRGDFRCWKSIGIKVSSLPEGWRNSCIRDRIDDIYKDYGGKMNEWNARCDLNINKVQGHLDNLGSDAQMANNSLQNLMEKMNNSLKQVTKAIDTDSQAVQNTLRTV